VLEPLPALERVVVPRAAREVLVQVVVAVREDVQAGALLIGEDGRVRVEELLAKYPQMWGELSYRWDVAEGGTLAPLWQAMFAKHPTRFLVGSDTWVFVGGTEVAVAVAIASVGVEVATPTVGVFVGCSPPMVIAPSVPVAL